MFVFVSARESRYERFGKIVLYNQVWRQLTTDNPERDRPHHQLNGR